MKVVARAALGALIASVSVGAAFAAESVETLKAEIVALAQSFEGQGDPDFSKQRQLDALVERLLALAPQPPVEARLDLLQGAWRQIWGPYDYRNDDRGVDPEVDVDEIYQVVSPGGYYYNVAPFYKGGDRSRVRIALLRGVYQPADGYRDMLKVRFTRYPGVRGRPETPLWELPALAEADELEDKISIVPTFIVRIFFGGGGLREVYTDQDLRITYGADGLAPEDRRREAIYVMERVTP